MVTNGTSAFSTAERYNIDAYCDLRATSACDKHLARNRCKAPP